MHSKLPKRSPNVLTHNGSTSFASSQHARWATNITGFTDNTTWPHDTGYGVCERGWEGCNYRQDLFVNNTVVRRYLFTSNLTNVQTPAWVLDYSTSEAITNFDPTPAASAGVFELSYQVRIYYPHEHLGFVRHFDFYEII